MDSKVIIIAVVAVVVVAGAAGGAIFLMNKDNGDKEYTAQELANKFLEDYDGSYGKFTVVDGATDDLAKLTATVKTIQHDGQEGKDRVSNIEIHHYASEEDAHKAFLDFITNSKNGSKGKTLLDQQDKLGMASGHLKIYDLRETSAGDFGATHAFLFYAAYTSTTPSTAEFTQLAGAIEDGKNVIVFNQTSDLDVYLNKPILDTVGEGVNGITVDGYEKILKDFCKAF